MKSNIYTALIFSLTILLSFTSTAQNGTYDVRFNMNRVDCVLNKSFVDVEVRATSAANTFNLSDQNYRFSYNREAVAVGSAEIDQEHVSGFMEPLSFYAPHTLTGSIDTIISYNVELSGGAGVLITTAWTTIGTISFDIIDQTKCLNLKWHDHAPENFPPTFIGEKMSNTLYVVTEGNYYNASVCPEPICGNTLPVELVSFEGNEKDCTIALEWITETETDNDFFEVQRSLDGREFEVIGRVNGSGTTLKRNFYTFIDEAPSTLAYYRIKQVDFDGTAIIYDIIAIRSACYVDLLATTITDVFPNPIRIGDVKFKFYSSGTQSTANIMVTDMLGRIVLKQKTEISKGINELSFSSETLTPGTYFFKMAYGRELTKAQKLIKLD